MTVKKVTVSMDPGTHGLAEQAARRAGMTLSAWLTRAARREAVRLGAGPRTPDLALADALADEAEHAAAEEDMRAAG
jgi:hypothetical protein